MHILVVEDHETLRALVLQQLRALGYSGEAVSNGIEALQKMLQRDFDLILMDLVLPEMDGLEAAKRIRQIEQIAKQKRIPIVATSAMYDRQECLDAGIDDFMDKPVLLENLRTMLNRWLNYKTTHSTRRILIVEDDETNRRVMSILLERMGHDHDFAHNGAEAVSMARENEYGLILMDIRMPELDGYKATKAIRASAAGRNHIPIVAVTAQAMDGDLEKCIWAGMNDYLSKPYTSEELETVVHR
ncbi:MAG: response regulator, partial [Terriglobales bacterium]